MASRPWRRRDRSCGADHPQSGGVLVARRQVLAVGLAVRRRERSSYSMRTRPGRSAGWRWKSCEPVVRRRCGETASLARSRLAARPMRDDGGSVAASARRLVAKRVVVVGVVGGCATSWVARLLCQASWKPAACGCRGGGVVRREGVMGRGGVDRAATSVLVGCGCDGGQLWR